MQESSAHRISLSTEKGKVCEIDVHKSFLIATILDREGNRQTRRVAQDIESLLEFREWILSENCNSVGFESTGDYWRSLFIVLQDRVPVTVANANHIKHVPTRKTDITDSRWIVQLELNDLITPSQIFDGEMYDLRSLTRSRELLVQNRTELKNKVHHLLDCTNIRLSSVLTDLFGKSGSIILKGLVQNKPFEEIINSLPKRMRARPDAIITTLPASIPPLCLILLQSYLNVIDILDKEIKHLEGKIREALASKSKELDILTSVPGIGFIGASTLIAEIDNIHDFENADKLAKWAGLTPSVYQSANVTRTGSITKQGSRQDCGGVIGQTADIYETEYEGKRAFMLVIANDTITPIKVIQPSDTKCLEKRVFELENDIKEIKQSLIGKYQQNNSKIEIRTPRSEFESESFA
jgi:transposase